MKTCSDCPAFRSKYNKECICQCGTKKIRIADVCVMPGFCRTDTRFYETGADDEMCTRGYILLACKKQIKMRRIEWAKAAGWEATAKVAAEANEKLHNHIDSLNDEIDSLKEYIRSLNEIIDDISERN